MSASLLLATACSGGDQEKHPLNELDGMTGGESAALPAGLTVSSAARLDSGNVAFRMRAYPEALRYYRAAASDVPDHPAPWYGILMVAQATGNAALTDSATRAVAARSGGGDLLDTTNVMTHKTPTAVLPTSHP